MDKLKKHRILFENMMKKRYNEREMKKERE